MEEILKQILCEIKELNTNQSQTDRNIEILGERMGAIDRSNKQEFKELNRKLDGITEVVAKTMEDITGLNDKVNRQDIELKVLKGGK